MVVVITRDRLRGTWRSHYDHQSLGKTTPSLATAWASGYSTAAINVYERLEAHPLGTM